MGEAPRHGDADPGRWKALELHTRSRRHGRDGQHLLELHCHEWQSCVTLGSLPHLSEAEFLTCTTQLVVAAVGAGGQHAQEVRHEKPLGGRGHGEPLAGLPQAELSWAELLPFSL